MITTKAILMAAGLAVGAGACGGEEAVTTMEVDPLVSTEWSADLGPYCAAGLTFDDSHNYARLLLCLLPAGGVGEEFDSGTYTVDGDRIEMAVAQSTCPSAAPNDFPGFVLAGKTMQVYQPTRFKLAGNVASYRLVAPGTGTGTTSPVTRGCFGALGKVRDFTPTP